MGNSIDQAHEEDQQNLREDGRDVGLTKISSQLLRWMNRDPKISRVFRDFETGTDLVDAGYCSRHSFTMGQVPHMQGTLKTKLKSSPMNFQSSEIH